MVSNNQRIGIVGLEHVVILDHVINAINTTEGFDLVALCDYSNEDRNVVAKEYGVEFYNSLDKFLENSEVDSVFVSVSNNEHYDVAKQILLSGKNVLLEKPGTKTMEELEELTSLSRDKGLTLVIAYHAAHALDLKEFVRMYREKPEEFGELVGFRQKFFDPYIENGEVNENGVILQGSWIDSGINALSVISQIPSVNNLSLFGQSTNVTLSPQYGENDIHRNVDFSFVNNSGITCMGTIVTNWTMGLNHKSTTLQYANKLIELNHSEEKIYDVTSGRKELADLTTNDPRLTNHFRGVFSDYRSHITDKTDNLDVARQIQRLHLLK